MYCTIKTESSHVDVWLDENQTLEISDFIYFDGSHEVYAHVGSGWFHWMKHEPLKCEFGRL